MKHVLQPMQGCTARSATETISTSLCSPAPLAKEAASLSVLPFFLGLPASTSILLTAISHAFRLVSALPRQIPVRRRSGTSARSDTK
jgi:hypothetical protein